MPHIRAGNVNTAGNYYAPQIAVIRQLSQTKKKQKHLGKKIKRSQSGRTNTNCSIWLKERQPNFFQCQIWAWSDNVLSPGPISSPWVRAKRRSQSVLRPPGYLSLWRSFCTKIQVVILLNVWGFPRGYNLMFMQPIQSQFVLWFRVWVHKLT